MKKTKKLTIIIFFTAVITAIVTVFIIKFSPISKISSTFIPKPSPFIQATFIPYPSAYINPTPTPTARPLTFEEMNKLYGPCTYLPTIMYHYIDNADVAKAGGYTSLNVTITSFSSQMQYIKDKGYQTLTPTDLINFFNNGTPIPAHPIMITFDDGYEDFYVNAYPLLKSLGLHATMFLPTGLVENNRYLTWNQISEMADSGLIYFANHTWSHKNIVNPSDSHEIDLADQQLSEHGLNPSKVFAYPYGEPSNFAVSYLSKIGYQLGYTTWSGSIQCKGQRLTLPRIRIGNAPLSTYGF